MADVIFPTWLNEQTAPAIDDKILIARTSNGNEAEWGEIWDLPITTSVSTAIWVVQSDINAHEARIDNPHAVTKAQVGLSNVDNTSDLNKPISTATQTALNTKQDQLTGLTASVAELNLLDWATLSTTELNYVDWVTSPIQNQFTQKSNVTISDYLNKKIEIGYDSAISTQASQQWVISDGTYIYSITNDYCRKYNSSWTLIASRVITTDVPSQTHKWDWCYHDGYLYIASWWDGIWEVWAILKLNASDLSFVSYTLTEWWHDASAIARKSDWTFWVTSYNDIDTQNPKIYKYSSTLSYIWVYELESFSTTLAYDGLDWDGDFLLANLHNNITKSQWLCVYYFDGTQFILKQKIPHLWNWIDCGQWIALDPVDSSVLWAVARDTSQVVKLSYTPAETTLAVTENLTQNSNQNLELAITPSGNTISGSILLDSSKNHWHGTVSWATYIPNGWPNNEWVYDFDGVDDYIELNDGMPITYLSFTQSTTPTWLDWKPDGTILYVVASSSQDTVYSFTCSIPWEASTGVLRTSFSLSTWTNDPTGFNWNNDGTKAYVTSNQADDIKYFTASVAYDETTLSYVGAYSTWITGTVFWMKISPAGTNFYFIESGSDIVYQHVMSTPWDMSTASSVRNQSVAWYETGLLSVDFNSDGTKMFIVWFTWDDVTEFTLGTAGDISTLTATWVTFYIWNQESWSQYWMMFWNSGKKLYLVARNASPARIYQYDLYGAYTLTNPSYSNGFTVIGWIKADSSWEGNAKVIDKSNADAAQYWFNVSIWATRLQTRVNSWTVIESWFGSITYWNWYHIACVVSSAWLVKHYVDWLESWISWTTWVPTGITTQASTRIGNISWWTWKTFDWSIWPIRIYSRVLTANEIMNDYLQSVNIDNPPEVPRLTTTMRDLLSPPKWQNIYNITTFKHQWYNGSWNNLY